MAAGIGNPLGAVCLFDGGCPRIVTALADRNISGGTLVYFSGASTTCLGSQAASYAASDLIMVSGASGAAFGGIALQDTGSNTYGQVATRGAYIIVAASTLTNSYLVAADGNNAVTNAGSNTKIDFNACGRCLIPAGSEGYALIDLHG